MNSKILIQKYFSKSLSTLELLEFNHRLMNDAAFKEELKFLTDTRRVAQEEEDLSFKSQLSAYESEIPDQKENESPPELKKSILAIIGILILVITTLYILDIASTEEDLFGQFFTPAENANLQSLKAEQMDDAVYKAFVAYNKAEYLKSIHLFDSVYIHQPNSEILYYQGNALLAVMQIDEAILKFKAHLNSSDSLTVRSHWYLALAYLKNEDIDLAKAELRFLLNSKTQFKNAEARELIAILETLPKPL